MCLGRKKAVSSELQMVAWMADSKAENSARMKVGQWACSLVDATEQNSVDQMDENWAEHLELHSAVHLAVQTVSSSVAS